MTVSALLLAAMLAQAAPPPQADTPTQAPAAAETPEQAATTAFFDVCLVGLAGSRTPADYAANSDEVGRTFSAQHPSAQGLTVQGYDGHACRVVYTGAQGGPVFARLAGLVAVPGCEPSEVSDTVVRSRCALPNDGPAGGVEIFRPNTREDAPVTATVLFLPPAPPSDAIPTSRR